LASRKLMFFSCIVANSCNYRIWTFLNISVLL
jgi:hypothetical protein